MNLKEKLTVSSDKLKIIFMHKHLGITMFFDRIALKIPILRFSYASYLYR